MLENAPRVLYQIQENLKDAMMVAPRRWEHGWKREIDLDSGLLKGRPGDQTNLLDYAYQIHFGKPLVNGGI